nr:DUF6113 family protein [Rhizohabitans arisaemae]
MLFMLGVMTGFVGGFQHGWYLGGVPASAVGLVLFLFTVLLWAGWSMRSKLAAFTPAAGWLIVSFLFSTPRGEGDLVIAANLAGYVYLYGGALMVLAAVLLTKSARPWTTRQLPGSDPLPD